MKKRSLSFVCLVLSLIFVVSCSSQTVVIGTGSVTKTALPAVSTSTYHITPEGSETPLHTPDKSETESAVPKTSTTPSVTSDKSETPAVTSEASETPHITPTGSGGSEEKRVSFLAVGDNLIHLAIATIGAADKSEDDGFDFGKIYAPLSERIAAADISFINQETMLDDSKKYQNYPSFNGPEALADDLAAVGFDIAAIGSNHTLDTGASGAIATYKKFSSVGITTVGVYLDENDRSNIRVIEKNGIKIAFLSYTYGSNYSYNKDEGKCSVVLPFLSETDKIKEELKAAHEIADFVMVFAHWGRENTFETTTQQREYAGMLADNGADLIIGTHPHTIQPVEWLTAEDGRRVLCAYSLGNFISMMANAGNHLGGMLEFEIVMDKDGVHAENVLLTPVVFFFDKNYANNSVMLLSDFTDEMAKNHGVHLYPKDSDKKNDITVGMLLGYYNDTIDEEFRIKTDE